MDTNKVEKVIKKLHQVFNKAGLTVPEILVAYGNLGYHLGAAIAGVSGPEGPNLQLLQREYYRNPTVDVALMLQGLTITSWEEDFRKLPKLSDLAKQGNNEEDK